jgi:cbb3-type cytochrome oxidase maturation protein
MEILIMQVFVSLALGLGSVLLFLFSARQRDFDHADRLALLPLDTDDDAKRSEEP